MRNHSEGELSPVSETIPNEMTRLLPHPIRTRARVTVINDEGLPETPPTGDRSETASVSSLPDSIRQEEEAIYRLTKQIESYDYDEFESRVALQHMQEQTEDTLRMIMLGRWIMTFLIGMTTAMVAIFIQSFTSKLQAWKFATVGGIIQQELLREREQTQDGHKEGGWSWSGQAYLAYVGTCLGFVLIASFFVAKVCPVAGGSGIPEIKCTLNGIKIPRVVRIKTLAAKMFGIILSVSSGLPIGKEGPMIHSGAVVGAGLSQGKSTSFGLDTSFSKFSAFRNDKEKRDFIACGAAAGVAAAFGSPVGGVLFSLEEGASFWHQSLTWRAFFCAMVSAFTLNIFLTYSQTTQTLGYLGSQTGTFSFGSFSSIGKEYVAWEVSIFVLMGIGGGLLGALFNSVNTKITKARMGTLRDWKVKVLEALFVTALVTSTQYLVPYFFGKCLPRPSEEKLTTAGELNSFFCRPEEYNDLASLWFVPYDVSIKQLLHFTSEGPESVGVERGESFDMRALLLFFLPGVVLTCIVYGISIPSGLFVPTIMMGSAYGRIWVYLLRRTSIPIAASDGMYALMGAASFLGGVSRMTISLTVIILECTGVMEWGLPLMACLLAARWAGNYFNEGIYDIHIHLKKMPFLESEPPFFSKFLRAHNVMNKGVPQMEVTMKVGELYDKVYNSNNAAYPVVQKLSGINMSDNVFQGLILRKHACVILQRKDFFKEKPTPFIRKPAGRQTFLYNQQYSLSYKDMEGGYPKFPAVDTIHVSDWERDLWVDLSPYMNCTPFVIREDTPLPRAYRLFRSLGLRHLTVVDQFNSFCGFITRKDVTPQRIKMSLARLSDDEKAKVQWYFSHRRNRSFGTERDRELARDINAVIRTPRSVAMRDDYWERDDDGALTPLLSNDDTTYSTALDMYVGDIIRTPRRRLLHSGRYQHFDYMLDRMDGVGSKL